MSTFIKRIAGGKKGMEALQAVLLLGAAFLVVMGLRDQWKKSQTDVDGEFSKIVRSS